MLIELGGIIDPGKKEKYITNHIKCNFKLTIIFGILFLFIRMLRKEQFFFNGVGFIISYIVF